MLKFAIVGAENSHCPAVAKLCNVEKKLAARVSVVWGETAKFAKAAAEAAEIPQIVKDWRDIPADIDGVMIDHRHPGPHFEVAQHFIQQGIPTFVDKPFTLTLRQGKELCRLAAKHKTPITSFSVIPLQKNFKDFKKQVGKMKNIVNVTTTGPCDLKSKYGGIFFYGIHQVDAIIEAFGTAVDRVSVTPHGTGGVAQMFYKDGPTVTMNLVNNGYGGFHWSAVGDSILHHDHAMDEDGAYTSGARCFLKMFRTKVEPFSYERLLAPVAVLEAMAKSLKLKKPVKVAKF